MTLNKGHLLVIDDEPSICDVLRLGLTRAGHRVQTATSIAAARAILADDIFDLLITDLQLPDGDGIGSSHFPADPATHGRDRKNRPR